MLASLRHHSLVGRYDEKTEIDSAGANYHATDKVFVAGDIHHSNGADSLERKRCKSEVDRDAPTFLFGQAIGIDAGQGLDQSSLTMIDMARRADDHAALQRSCSQTANARRGRSSARWAPRNSRRSR